MLCALTLIVAVSVTLCPGLMLLALDVTMVVVVSGVTATESVGDELGLKLLSPG